MSEYPRKALLVQALGRQEALLRAALESQGIAVATLARGESIAAQVGANAREHRPADLLVVDLAALAEEGLRLGTFGPSCRARRPDALLLATLGRRIEVAESERRWARAQGAFDLWPGWSMTFAGAASIARLAALTAALGIDALDPRTLERSLRALANEIAEAEGDVTARLAQRGIDVGEIAQRMRGSAGVTLEERRYRLKWYRNCFVGSEAVDWLVRGYGLAREDAADLGQHLLERGAIHHVVKERPFIDGNYFYRLGGADPALEAIEIDALVGRMRGPQGLAIRERSYLGRAFAACFVGREAVDWLCANHAVAREDAVTLGQRLVDLDLAHHVLDEHDFVDGHYFYRFRIDERG